jgi:hypothetical protein
MASIQDGITTSNIIGKSMSNGYSSMRCAPPLKETVEFPPTIQPESRSNFFLSALHVKLITIQTFIDF